MQRAIVEYYRYANPSSYKLIAVPNQRGTRSRAEMGILWALGVRPGVADLLVLHGKGRTLHVEVKAPGREGRLSEEQKSYLEDVTRLGHPYYVVSSLDDFLDVLRRHKLIRDG